MNEEESRRRHRRSLTTTCHQRTKTLCVLALSSGTAVRRSSICRRASISLMKQTKTKVLSGPRHWSLSSLMVSKQLPISLCKCKSM